MARVDMRSPDGRIASIRQDAVDKYISQGFQPVSAQEKIMEETKAPATLGLLEEMRSIPETPKEESMASKWGKAIQALHPRNFARSVGQGALTGAVNIPANIAETLNKINPLSYLSNAVANQGMPEDFIQTEAKLPKMKSSGNLISKGTESLMDVLGMGGAGALVKKGAQALSSLPAAIGKGAEWLAKGEGFAPSAIARSAIGTGAYDVSQHPERNMALSFVQGFAPSAAIDLTLKGLGKGYSKIKSFATKAEKELGGIENEAKDVLTSITGGKGIRENAQEVSKLINKSYKEEAVPLSKSFDELNKALSKEDFMFSPLAKGNEKAAEDFAARFIKMGQPIPESIQKQLGTIAAEEGTYKAISPDIVKDFLPSIKKMHTEFLEKPNYQNGQSLLKQLNFKIASMKKNLDAGKLSEADHKALEHYQEAKNILEDNIINFLATKPGNLAEQFIQTNKGWFENVIPFKLDKDIYQMARGKKQTPQNIINILKRAEQKNEPHLEKILNKMPEEFFNAVLATELGKTPKKDLVSHLTKKFDAIKDKGLGQIIPEKLADKVEYFKGLEDSINQLKKSDKLRKRIVATPLGAVTGAIAPGITAPETLEAFGFGKKAGAGTGALAAAMYGPQLALIMSKLKGKGISDKQLYPIYDAIKKAAMSTYVGGNQ